MAWSYRKNSRHRNPKKDVARKAACNKTKRKTKNEMAGWRVHGPEKDGNKRMERQSKGSRGLEAYCKGGQGPPRAVAPPKKFHWILGCPINKSLHMNFLQIFYFPPSSELVQAPWKEIPIYFLIVYIALWSIVAHRKVSFRCTKITLIPHFFFYFSLLHWEGPLSVTRTYFHFVC